MLAIHVLIKDGYGYEAVMDMDETDLEDFLKVSRRYNELQREE